jgi:murein DD-endopeptidase MepM/ murein hydrolase activator NlpD
MPSRRIRIVAWVAVSVLLGGCAGGARAEQPATPAATPLLAQAPATSIARPTVPAPTGQPRSTQHPPATVTLPAASEDIGVSVSGWNPAPYRAPLALRPEDHFYLSLPLPSGSDSWLHPRYRYGNTHFGEEPTHTGVDIVSESGTTVLAAGSGYVVWAGYGLYRGVEDEDDPYGLAVAIEHDFGYQDQTLYTIYAHLEQIDVYDGQHLEAGDLVGLVGTTGHASGPHLHFEVRLGENRYFATRNPELWLVPAEGWGVLVGRFFGSWGELLYEQPISIVNLDTGERFEAWTYAEDTVNPDDGYHENVVISNLPAGPYEVRINHVGHTFTAQMYIFPGQSNLIEFHGRSGFSLEDR